MAKAVDEELVLLIKSKYPVIFVETIDEEYVVNQLYKIAENFKFEYFQWSVTSGLQRGAGKGGFYQTKSPIMMLKTIHGILDSAVEHKVESGLFVFKDFPKYFEDAVCLRMFKDLVQKIKNTTKTVVILSSSYSIPHDIEPYTAHIVGGYPSEQEIVEIVNTTLEEFRRNSRPIQFSLDKANSHKMVRILKGLSTQQIRNVLNRCFTESDKLGAGDLSRIERCKKKIFDREGILEFCLSESKDNIANFDSLKKWLAERKSSFTPNSAMPPVKGVLLMGVQGCGKSLAIKVIARELNLALYRLDVGRLYSKYIGQTEENLRRALGTVEKLSPICLWIDEIEKGFAVSDGDVDGGVSQRVLGTFLTWMQERKESSFIAATANNIHALPPEFLRKGRFDEIFFVDLPDATLREDIFRIHLRKRNLDAAAFDCALLAEKADGFNGAEIEQALIAALYRATSQKEAITTKHIVEQIESTRPLSVVKQEEIAELREWARERTISA